MSLTLKEAMQVVNRRENGMPVPFDIEYVSYDSNKHRSGRRSELRKLETCIKVNASHDSKANATITMKKLHGRGISTAHIKLIMKINDQWVR